MATDLSFMQEIRGQYHCGHQLITKTSDLPKLSIISNQPTYVVSE